MWSDLDRTLDAFRTGDGVPWGDHDGALYCFTGFDTHEGSVDAARANADAAGLSDRVHFQRADAKSYPRGGYDLVCFFDVLHDLGDPVGAARHAYEALADDGTLMVVEPFAGTLSPRTSGPSGAFYYSGSTALCVPHSLSEEVGLALGAQAGPARLADVLHEAGFGSVRHAYESPFNIVLEASR